MTTNRERKQARRQTRPTTTIWTGSSRFDARAFLRPRKTREIVSGYIDFADVIRQTAQNIFQPPQRISVSEAAEQYRYINNRGQYVGWWKNAETPYMVEPMDVLNSREFDSCVFVGPAQSGKTDALIINWALFSAVVDPMDLIIYSPSGAAAKDFSVRRIDRLVRDSKDMKKALLTDKDADGKFQKQFKSGMLLTLSWPSTNELSGKPVGRVAITDYDRIEDDIGGEGSAYDLGYKRTTTFGSFKMTLAESSPSREVEDTKKILSSPHEAPPCKGILSLYNRGDRRLWYWPCPSCGNHFSPKFEYLVWNTKLPNHSDAADTVHMQCPSCSYKIEPRERKGMQALGVWLRDGQAVVDGFIVGDARRSNIASFWLEGTAARFTTWAKLVKTYLDAKKELDDTGSEEALKKFYNTDLGRPYVPKSMMSDRVPAVMQMRAEPMEYGLVPQGVRALVATIDVQMNRFVVQVHGILPGRPHDIIVIDRFDIVKSTRLDNDGDPYPVRPGTYQEDWDQIIEFVINRQYPLDDDTGRTMAIKLTLCDSGGEQNTNRSGTTGSGGVTSNAYAFYRALRKQGLAHKFHLVRGDGNPNAPRVHIDMPDSRDRKNLARAQGDVPVMRFNSNMLKDTLSNLLDVLEPGKGLIRWPDWLDDWWFEELCAEVRTDKGWDARRKRNEAWDLLYYLVGAGFSSVLPLHRVDWSNPPPWLAPWDSNPLVTTPANDDEPASAIKVAARTTDYAALGRQLAGNGD
jgi:phage terminase large subunit GpA-like protein